MTKEAVAELKKKIGNDKQLKHAMEAVRTTAVNAMLGIASSKGLKVDASDAKGLLELLGGGAGDGELSLDAMSGLSGGEGGGGGGGGFGGGGGGQGSTGGGTF